MKKKGLIHIVIKQIAVFTLVTLAGMAIVIGLARSKGDKWRENTSLEGASMEETQAEENQTEETQPQGPPQSKQSEESVSSIEKPKTEASEIEDDSTDNGAGEETGDEGNPVKEQDMDIQINELLGKMSLEEKIWQMFIITADQLVNPGCSIDDENEIMEGVNRCPVGGVIYFAHNLTNPEQTARMLEYTQKASLEKTGLKMFTCVDEEGGNTARIAQNPEFGVENVGPMAEIGSMQAAKAAGEYIGEYLQKLGFNVDFAPDADVITNPANVIIGSRSFGEDADIVTKYSIAYSDGLHSQNVLSTFKHFPGHGATEADTHEGYAYTNKTYEELRQSELVPFMAAGANGVDFIMVAHISVPNVIGDNTPCTLSYKMVTEILRNDLGYDGLIVTDALNMGAITTKYDHREACVKAIQAGNDLVLMPLKVQEDFEAVLEAVNNGEISVEQIDKSVARILHAKLRF